jgi:hypothetical protein
MSTPPLLAFKLPGLLRFVKAGRGFIGGRKQQQINFKILIFA